MTLLLILLKSSVSFSSRNSNPVVYFYLKVNRNLYSRVLVRDLSMNLSEDEALLQKHQGKTVTKDLKMPVVKDLLGVHHNRINKEIWLFL